MPRFTISQAQVRLSAACPVQVQRLRVHDDVLAHDHDYYEIGVIGGGQAWHCTRDGRRLAKAGAVFVMPPGSVHALMPVRHLTVTNIYYLSEWLLTELRTLWDVDGLVRLFLANSLFRHALPEPQFDLTDSELGACECELRDIEQEVRALHPSKVYLKAAFLKLLTGLSRAYARHGGRLSGFDFRAEVWAALEQVELCLAERRPFSVREAARRCGLSVSYFSRVFREATGQAPLDYFQRRRIQQACALLLNSRLSISAVAHTLGFADGAHLSRLFHRQQGSSPREYRALYRPARSAERHA